MRAQTNKAPGRGQLNDDATYVVRLPICSKCLNQLHYREPNLQFYIRAVNDLL